jgi:transposase, IS30 family
MGRRIHLSYDERVFIEISLRNGVSQKDIAIQLKRSKGCINKEIKRYKSSSGFYSAIVATSDRLKKIKKSRYKNKKINQIPQIIMDEIFNHHMKVEKQSVASSAVILKKDYSIKFSTSSLYRYLDNDEKNGGKLCKLKTRKGKKNKYKNKIVQVKISDKISIELRASRDDLMFEPGHWEIDTIFGKAQDSFLLTLVDIATMYTIIIKLPDKTSKSVEAALLQLFETTNLPLKSITSDNGGEFACHKTIMNTYGIKWYFCHPYSSWERGLNENTNGLIRRFFPKGTDFNKVTDTEIRAVQNILNNSYRERIGQLKPKDIMVNMLINQAA